MQRVIDFIPLTHLQIQQLCEPFFGKEQQLTSFELIFVGAVNTTYKILWGRTSFILRLYVRDPSFCEVDQAIHRLIQSKVPVADLLYSNAAAKPYPFAIFKFVEGIHLHEIPDKKLAPTISYQLGKILAIIHSFHFPKAGFLNKQLTIQTVFPEGSSLYYEYIQNILIPSSAAWKYLGKLQSTKLLEFITLHKNTFPIASNGGSLVHSDFKPLNILWGETGLTILDWEFAHSGNGLLDFGILLRHFKEFPLIIESLEQGYLDHGGLLEANWIQQARITDLVCIIELLNHHINSPHLRESLAQSILLTMHEWKNLDKILRNL